MTARLLNPVSKAFLVAGLLLGVVLAGCSRPDCDADTAPGEPEIGDSACVVIPVSPNAFGYNYRQASPAWWRYGCYNPRNGEEAAVVMFEFDPNGSTGNRLYRMNLRTGQRTLLFTGAAVEHVAWSRTGWIAFTRAGNLQVWKIKADGDSLTQVTPDRGVNTAECWSPDGRFIVSSRTYGPSNETGLAMYTAGGSFVRLLPAASTKAFSTTISWSPDGRRLAYIGGATSRPGARHLCLYDLTTDRLDSLRLPVVDSLYDIYLGLHWLPNGNEVVWAGRLGIGLTNVNTGQTRLVRTNCVGGNRDLLYPDVSPDGQQLLLTHGQFTVSPTEPNTIIERYWLETCNLRGTQLRRVMP